MKHEIKIPSVGESVATADIECWQKPSGAFVNKGDIIAILETDKASVEVPAEVSGQLHIVKAGGEAKIGETIGFIDDSVPSDTSATAPAKPQIPLLSAEKPTQTSSSQPPHLEKTEQKLKSLRESPPAESKRPLYSPPDGKKAPLFNTKGALSPAVKRLVETHHLQPEEITGTGRGGRLTKEDILNALQKGDPSMKPASNTGPSGATAPKSAPLRPGQRREPMSRLRKRTAERLIRSQKETASLSTFNTADMSAVIDIRKKHGPIFLKKHGVKLGFMSFFVRSAAKALQEYPKINAFVEGDNIIYNESQNINIAISSDKGLVAPVLFQAESLKMADIEKKILEYRDKALARQLSPDDLFGGTFTISNGGVFGSLLSTPILNPPQSGILGLHKIEQRPVAINGQLQIRPMMYLALTYDHRIVDGKEAISFLLKIKELIEDPVRLLTGI